MSAANNGADELATTPNIPTRSSIVAATTPIQEVAAAGSSSGTPNAGRLPGDAALAQRDQSSRIDPEMGAQQASGSGSREAVVANSWQESRILREDDFPLERSRTLRQIQISPSMIALHLREAEHPERSQALTHQELLPAARYMQRLAAGGLRSEREAEEAAEEVEVDLDAASSMGQA
eukprot:TRINITY_DN105711_c0_g1_i1.p1 TRINITY_DN105711_c0_g1~~TRINITY_DN105711_c0_g1_i1.p1  ORF type:complete len:178 (+),score=46.56 TRINITY_DN105711_c0_g1_i1:163-696(+)